MNEYAFTVVIERDEDGRYVALCPALQGCFTDGETEDEAMRNIEEVIRLHIQDRLENGETIPKEFAARMVRLSA